MAKEITVGSSLRYAAGDKKASMSGAISPSAAGGHYAQKVVDVDTSEVEFTFDDVVTQGWCLLRNTDADSTIEVGPATGVYAIKLLAGEVAGPMRWDAASMFAVAAPYAAELELLMIEE